MDHKAKINKADAYFRKNNLHVCTILAQGCPGQTSDVDDGNWDKVIVDTPADTEARLSIFYADFVYDHNQNPVIESPPDVEPKMLQRACKQLVIAEQRTYCLAPLTNDPTSRLGNRRTIPLINKTTHIEALLLNNLYQTLFLVCKSPKMPNEDGNKEQNNGYYGNSGCCAHMPLLSFFVLLFPF